MTVGNCASLKLTMKITNKMYYIDSFIIPSRSTCFGRCFRPLSGALNCIYSSW